MMELLDLLEEKRKEKGMTYKELAALVGANPDTIRGCLQGWRKSDFYTIRHVAKELGFDIKIELTSRATCP